jgi:manganese efflux pump family protein
MPNRVGWLDPLREQNEHMGSGNAGRIAMGLSALLLLALGISMDNFAVSLGIGTANPVGGLKENLRVAIAFGVFQFFMPLLGWLAGSKIVFIFCGYESWFLCAALAFAGGCMLRPSRQSGEAQQMHRASPGALFSLAFATSVDSLVVGFGLSMIRVNILEASGLIGAVTACLSLAGVLFSARLGRPLGRHSRFAGGLVLVTVGLYAVVPH